MDALYTVKEMFFQIIGRKINAVAMEILRQCAAQDGGLLIDFLDHIVGIAHFICGIHIPIHLFFRQRYLHICAVVETHGIRPNFA